LRLVLSAAARGIHCLPHAFEPRAQWLSEALLYSPFAPRTRGDLLGESVTHADGSLVILKLAAAVAPGSTLPKTRRSSSSLSVTEAKMFSGLSKGTTWAREYDQAARNVACLAWAVSKGGQPPDAYRSLGFWVVALEVQIAGKVLPGLQRIHRAAHPA
jgi:hypothetical protein